MVGSRGDPSYRFDQRFPCRSVAFTGPGANAVSLTLTPHDTVVVAGQSLTLKPSARDNAGANITNLALAWSVKDATRGTVDGNGVFTALAGVGRYATAILSDRWSLPLAAGVALGTVIAGIVGGVLAWVAVRRSLDVIFTGVVTLVFSLAFTQLLIGQSDLTGGDTGQVLEGAATNLADDAVGGYYLFVGLLVALLVVFRVLQLSHIGWAFRALRDDETAAQLAGVDVARYRIYAAVVGSAMIGLTGGLYAYSLGFISPVTYEFSQVDVQVLVIVAFGGLGTLLGPVVGAAAFGFLDRALTDSGQLREAYYGAFVIAIFLFLRRGVIPFVLGLFDRLAAFRRRSQRMDAATPGRAER